MDNSETFDVVEGLDIAIIGMVGRFPGARNLDEFWQNLRDGVESISFFTDEELEASGIDSALLKDPHYIKADGVLEGAELFDAPFFGFYPRAAEILDPQHRLFLECAWEALENAGYAPGSGEGTVGVYAGASTSDYLWLNLLSNREITELHGNQLFSDNNRELMPTLISYKLNLKGASINVQTACSTSLVAAHLACQSLLNYQCDMTLVGGVSINLPQKEGYLYIEGGIGSPDGHCRAFDAQARGTVGGNGVGIVVLKRLVDALADGDYIHAIIKGSAINNDGSLKVGYTAPSVEGQSEVIAMAQAIAGVAPQAIDYVETHGTGTVLGDPIEIAALTRAFRASTQAKGFCAIGSVKTNVGHLDAAAGVAGLLKTVLALEHNMVPPSLHFEQPNPKIDFENSPFYVNAALSEWKAPEDGSPRRAGVSSFGIGGTNAHVVLEQAPVIEPSGDSRPWQLLLLSAKTDSALETATSNLAHHLKQNPNLNLADVAYTYQVGRKAFDYRRMVVCRDPEDAVLALEPLEPQRLLTALHEPGDCPVTFMFTGLGDHYVDMALELYKVEPTFRAHLDHCSELLKPHLGLDLRDVLYPAREQAAEHTRESGPNSATLHQGFDLRKMLRRGEEQVDEHTQKLNQTSFTQPALFVIEYALAQLWMEWGVYPQAVIGYSIGEYVAACLAGVFSLEQALSLVAKRAQIIHDLPGGAMLAVPLSETDIQPLLTANLSLSAVNGPSLCVLSGPPDAVDELEHQLAEKGVACRRLQTSHAFHSNMMEPIMGPFTELVETFDLQPPQIPYVSNVTGTWITAAEATDPRYWARHACQAVRFADGISELLKEPARILLEVGPGRTLNTLVRQHPDCTRERVVLSSVRHSHNQQSDVVFLLTTLGKLWLAGAKVDWPGFYAHERRHRLPLPTYPFERQRYWIEPGGQPYGAGVTAPASTGLHKKTDIAEWFYLPSWKRSDLFVPFAECPMDRETCWLVFDAGGELGKQMSRRLTRQGQDIVTVAPGDRFERLDTGTYTINPQEQDDYETLIQDLYAQGKKLETVVHLWGITSNSTAPSNGRSVDEAQERGFYSLLFLAQALGKQNVTTPFQINVVTTNLQEVTGEEVLHPEKATVLGPCRVIPQEFPNWSCRSIDMVLAQPETRVVQTLVDQLLVEITAESSDQVVAYRGHHRWVQTFEPIRLEKLGELTPRLRKGGVYLITGGLGGVGLVLAKHLAETVQAKLILTGRSAFPQASEWEQWLANHDSQDSVSDKIRTLQELGEMGAKVMVARADVTVQEQMHAVVTEARERFGAIHGVIHTAGVPGGGIIQLKTPEMAANVLAPKVKGTLVLDDLFKDVQLDFLVLFSSLNAILGGFGQVDYCAANTFLDAFACQNTFKRHRLTISINWAGWRETGMMTIQTDMPDVFDDQQDTEFELTMLPSEGIEVFNRALFQNTSPQLAICTADIWAVIEDINKPPQIMQDGQLLPGLTQSEVVHPRPSLQTPYVSPRDELEEAIVALWQKVLGIEQVGVHDDFFELGGHSLLAVMLLSLIQQEFGENLALAVFLQGATVEQLADALRRSTDTSAWSSLVPIQPEGEKRPFFCVPGMGGNAIYLRELAQRLGPDQPFYGLQAVGLDGESEPHTRIEDMAAHYIKVVQSIQPRGPYVLGGHSFGSIVAFEMAQQLQRQDEQVAMVVILEGVPKLESNPTLLAWDDAQWLTHMAHLAEDMMGKKLGVSCEILQSLEPDEQLRHLGERLQAGGWLPPGEVELAPLRGMVHVLKADSNMQYIPQDVHLTRVVLFRSSEPLPDESVGSVFPEMLDDPILGWGEFAKGKVKVYKIPGGHLTMLREPCVRVLAEHLGACLEKVQGEDA